MYTDVHDLVWLEGRSTNPVDRQRVLLSGSGPGRTGGRPTESFCSLYPGLSRPAGRPMAQRSEIRLLSGRPGGWPTVGTPAELASNGHILGAYILGTPWAVFNKIWREFFGQFFLTISVVFSTCFRANIFKSNGEFIKSILKEISWVFHHQVNPSFLTHTWVFHCYIL